MVVKSITLHVAYYKDSMEHTVLEKAIQVTISLFGCYPLYLHGINSLWSYYWSYNGKKNPSMSGMSGMLKMSGETDRHQ